MNLEIGRESFRRKAKHKARPWRRTRAEIEIRRSAYCGRRTRVFADGPWADEDVRAQVAGAVFFIQGETRIAVFAWLGADPGKAERRQEQEPEADSCEKEPSHRLSLEPTRAWKKHVADRCPWHRRRAERPRMSTTGIIRQESRLRQPPKKTTPRR